MPITRAFARVFRKIRQVAVSDLVLAAKFRYFLDLAMGWLYPSVPTGFREFRLRDGISVFLRGHSTDEKVFDEIFIQRAYARYARAARRLAPVVLIDLGANIGLSVIALARELRPRAIVAVEPDRGNFATLRENLRLAGLTGKCKAVRAFAGAEGGFAELVDSGNGAWGMRMGAPARTGIPVLPVEEIVMMASIMSRSSGMSGGAAIYDSTAAASGNATVVLKCDIEGAEMHLFRHLRQWEDRVHYVILELHTEFLSIPDFQACIEASRYHWRMDGNVPAQAVLAVIGLERLERKAALQDQRFQDQRFAAS